MAERVSHMKDARLSREDLVVRSLHPSLKAAFPFVDEHCVMTDEPNKTPAKIEPQSEPTTWPSVQPFKALRKEVDTLFEDFDRGFWRSQFRSSWPLEPFFRSEVKWPAVPSVDARETENEFKVTAELPGMDEKNVEVTLTNNIFTIKGEKTEEKEVNKADYHVQERHYGSFERRFPVPESVDAAKIEATFKQGVLTVVLPKMVEAKRPEQKIEVKSG